MLFEDKSSEFKYSHVDSEFNRFHAIFLIDAKSGLTFCSKKYSTSMGKFNKHSDDLITGFLNALNYFVKEIDNANESIQEINFKKSRLLYDQKGRLMVIGFSKKTDVNIEREILSDILNDFYTKYRNYIENFKGNVQIFENFKKDLDHYNTSWYFRSGHINDQMRFSRFKID